MDTREKTKRGNPVEAANPINRLFFWWTLKLFRKGANNNLEIDDLYDPVRADESERLGNKLEREWNVELEKLKNLEYSIDGEGKKIKGSQRPSLTRAIFRAFWLKYLYIGMYLLLMSIVLRPMQPIFQGLIVRYFNGGKPGEIPTDEEVLYYATGLVLTTLAITFIVHHTNLDNQQIGMRIRVACCSLIYRKSKTNKSKVALGDVAIITDKDARVVGYFHKFDSSVIAESLRLSKSALDRTAAGQVVNLLSNDVNRFDFLPLFLNYVWIMPFQLIVVGYVMWQSVQICTLVGIAALLLLAIPIQGYLSKVSGKLRGRTAKLTDRRVQLMNELIAGIQVVKMYAWEKPFETIVSNTRAYEVQVIKLSSYLRGLYLSIMVFTERTTLFLTIISFVLMGNHLSAQITSELSTHFNILQMTTAIFFPQALIQCGEALVSIRRLEAFLLLDEVTTEGNKPKAITEKSENGLQTKKKSVTVELQRVSANWVSGVLPPTLCEVTMKIPSGKLCAMIGPVGSGKSSILNVLLRELPLGAGSISLLQNNDGKFAEAYSKRGYVTDNPDLCISYASQDAWLFSGSVRENILFGQPYEKTRYKEVAKVCALLKDFAQLPDGDMTIVNERGSGLSGGQRARINLARAIYRRADLYLLDDPLSAVDARVARHLFKNCILEYLHGKTRILVTHQLQFLKQADTIVMMDRGAAKHQGSWDDLTKSSNDFKDLLQRIEEEKVSAENHDEEKNEEEIERPNTVELENLPASSKELESPVAQSVDKWKTFRGSHEVDEETTLENSVQTLEDRKFVPPTAEKLPPLTLEIMRRASIRSQDSYGFDEDYVGAPNENAVEEEGKSTGMLSNRIYKLYFRAGGGVFILTLLVLNLIFSQAATSAADYWISYWANIELVRRSLHDSDIPVSTTDYNIVANNTLFSYFNILDEDGLIPQIYAIYIYTFFIIACIVLTMSRSFLFMKICMEASRGLHNTMFANVLQATMRFFNLNSSGRILNRFSKDIGAMDELLPKAMLEAVQIFLVLIGILVMVALVNQWMIIPMVIIAVLFYVVRIYYLRTAQDVKRLEGITKSPVFSHISSTLNGLTTIRSSGKEIQETLRKEFDRYQDTHTGAWFLFIATASSFGFVLDLVSCIFITCVVFSSILSNADGTLGGYVGLAISQSLILTGMLQYGVKLTADVQSQMTSVERVVEYTDLPKEGSLTSSNPPPPSWPENGRIQLRNVNMKYKIEDPPVLKDLNLVIEAGWKIGVVGRTGAGKSSLISALFRLTGDGLEGDVIIDGRNTGSIGLHELRSSISIIPQEPVLFSESLRYNLDPFGKYEDSALWDALREVELSDAALDQRVTEGGSNFSVGQRQLICLARAILRNNRVLVLDEATANIDSRTDALIQRTIRSKFANCTVITIAHRLNTIIDSDRVLVMDAGRMVEYGTPYELLHMKPDGHFAQMVQQTGSVMAQNLLNFALGAHRRHNSTTEVSAL